MTKINLIYSNTSLSFFDSLNTVKSALQKQQNYGPINMKDEKEIGRGDTYAFFDELKGKEITTELFRKSLEARGITDSDFQNRIFNLILQSRDCIQFGLGVTLDALLSGNGYSISHPPDLDNNIQLNGIDGQHIELIFKSEYSDHTDAPDYKPAFNVEMRFLISPDRVDLISRSKIMNKIPNRNVLRHLILPFAYPSYL